MVEKTSSSTFVSTFNFWNRLFDFFDDFDFWWNWNRTFFDKTNREEDRGEQSDFKLII